MAAPWALLIQQPHTSNEYYRPASSDNRRADHIREGDNESRSSPSLKSNTLDQVKQGGDNPATVSPSASENSKAPSKLRWRRRALQRHQYLNDSLTTRMRCSSSPSSIENNADPEIESETQRQFNFASTSLHFPDSIATPKRTSSIFTSPITPTYFSPQVNLLSQPSDVMSIPTSPISPTYFSPRAKLPSQPSGLLSPTSTSKTPTLCTSNSWLTCSEPGEASALIMNPTGPTLSTSVPAAPPDSEERALRKVKIFDVMLSAIDRKKKKNLPPAGNTALQATRAPSMGSLVPLQAPCVYNPRKLEPRGAAERQDFSSLRDFLDAHPAREEDKEESYEPRSEFDWESDDEENTEVSMFPRKHKQKHKQNSIDKAKAGGDGKSEGTEMDRGFKGILGNVGYGEDYGFSGAAMGNTESEVAGSGRWEVVDHVSGASPRGILVGGDQSPPRRGSVMQMFQDPVWQRGYDVRGEVAGDRQSFDQRMPGTTPDDGLNIPKFLARLKRGASTIDLRKGSGNAFAQEASRMLSIKANEEAYGSQAGENITLCYSDNATPSKRGRRQKNAEKLSTKLVLCPPYALSPASSSASSIKSSPRGLPQGPWDEDWDDAVKWVKAQVKDREGREAREARDRERETTEEEKKLKKLVAAKDAIKRSSHSGLALKKPLDDITEDELELVGEVMIAAKSSTPTTNANLLAALFTRMQGTKQERAKQAYDIGHCLDNHASLQMVNAIDPNILDQPPVETPRSQCDETLRMLEGEVPQPEVLVNPFERASANDNNDQQPSIGLGITSHEQEEQLAKDNLAQSRMSFGSFTALKRQRQEEAEHDVSRPSQPKQQPSSRAAFPGQESTLLRPMTTIEEATTESSHSPSEDSGENTAAGQTTQLEQNIGNFRSSHLNSEEDDANSFETIESDAIPPPLNVQKLRGKGKDTIEDQPGNRLMNIPVAHVDRSSQHLQATESNSFIPRRNSTFRDMIRATSRVQAAKLGNHPAFRNNAEDDDSASEYSFDDDRDRRPDSTAKHARVDSGIGIKDDELADEGYGTGPVGQQEFASSKAPPTPAKTADGNRRRQRVPTLIAPVDTTIDDARGIDMNVLRCELGLAPAQLPVGLDSPKHPSHPFTWHHEKLMCYGVHNSKSVQPDLPTIPENQPVAMNQIHQKHISSSPTKGKIVGVKVCTCCGAHCCRFANLFINSKMSTNKDVAEENVRMKAEQRVEKLRTYHPNGIEEYDTFLTCSLCKHKICPGCSTKCTERLPSYRLRRLHARDRSLSGAQRGVERANDITTLH